jgi:hypothetical protein
MELLVHLQKLIGRPGPVALLLGFAIVVVLLISGHCFKLGSPKAIIAFPRRALAWKDKRGNKIIPQRNVV